MRDDYTPGVHATQVNISHPSDTNRYLSELVTRVNELVE